MSVFYNNESTRYYIKISNINLPDTLKGYKAIDAKNTKELIDKIIDYYTFHNRGAFSIQLWSHGMRIDTLDKIPKENEFILARIIK